MVPAVVVSRRGGQRDGRLSFGAAMQLMRTLDRLPGGLRVGLAEATRVVRGSPDRFRARAPRRSDGVRSVKPTR